MTAAGLRLSALFVLACAAVGLALGAFGVATLRALDQDLPEVTP